MMKIKFSTSPKHNSTKKHVSHQQTLIENVPHCSHETVMQMKHVSCQ